MKRQSSGRCDQESREVMIKRKLAEVEQVLQQDLDIETDELPVEGQPTVTGPTDRAVVQLPDGGGEVVVVIGTSEHAKIPGMVDRICHIVDAAYSGVGKRKRVDEYDARRRLAMGDAGPAANRVLHLAFRGGELVGCASSTFDPGWTHEGCGHWGLLAVDPTSQGQGVATALVLACERRLATVSEAIQIEYEYFGGDEHSKRLHAWYEQKLGFDGGSPPPRRGSCFRRCLKDIPEAQQRRGQRRRLLEIRCWLQGQLGEAGGRSEGASLGTPAAVGPGPVAVS
jgi:GNAT superfamily N-acetyltransferase